VSEAAFLAHHTGVDVIVKVGATADVQTIVDDGLPTLQITWGSITVLLVPHAGSEGEPLVPCDVLRARDLARAATRYARALERQWFRQAGSPLPARYKAGNGGQPRGHHEPVSTGVGG
jgi:hypothetical protein